MCKQVITKRQKPNKLADVLNMCCEVLFAIGKNIFLKLNFDTIILRQSKLLQFHQYLPLCRANRPA
jgi:hypothetical protein